MIDQDKMRALLARINDCTKPVDAADRSGVLQYIDLLLAEVETGQKALRSAHAALSIALPHMRTDEFGNGPDCTPVFQALIECSASLAQRQEKS